jgi:hypothetical protein
MDARSLGLGLFVATSAAQLVALSAMVHSKAHRKYPAFAGYLAVCLLYCTTFGLLPYARHFISAANRNLWFFWGYWVTYLISTVLLFLTIQTIFREVMAPLPGLSRLGVLMFRWVVAISAIVALSSSYIPTEMSHRPFHLVLIDLMRCVSILELCLLAFVTLVAQKVGLSYKSLPFGLSLGFGISAASDFVQSAVAYHAQSLFSITGLACQLVGVAVLVMWVAYFRNPEPARSSVALPIASPLLRWNEVALALSHANAQVAPAPTLAHGTFLSDVENVVDRVLIKNSLKATNS